VGPIKVYNMYCEQRSPLSALKCLAVPRGI